VVFSIVVVVAGKVITENKILSMETYAGIEQLLGEEIIELSIY
jgi:hypothetical protein